MGGDPTQPRFQELPEPLTIPLDDYAMLKDVLADSGVDTLVLPGGGHEKLEAMLTCGYGHGWTCGAFVCYKHNPDFRPQHGEDTVKIPSPKGNVWSNPIPVRIIQPFEDSLTVKVSP